MTITDLVSKIPNLPAWKHADRIRLLGWAQHALVGRSHFAVADIAEAYDALHMAPPGNLHRDVQALVDQRHFLKTREGLRVAAELRGQLDEKYGHRPTAVKAHQLLLDQLQKVPAGPKRDYLEEAITCFRSGAWRAAVIMTWNLAYDHLCEHVVGPRLADFDRAYRARGQKKPASIGGRADLRDLKEADVIEICRAAGITDGTQSKCLRTHLDMRNDAAHPSGAVFHQPKVETAIIDLVETIVARIA